MDLDLYDGSYARFCDLLGRDEASILELGCGPGNVTRRLLCQKPGWRILATDTSPRMLELARRASPTIETQVVDARDLSSIEGLFDGVVCGFVLPYLAPEDVRSFVEQVTTKLKPGGLMYLSFVPGDPLRSGATTTSTGHRTHFHFHDGETLLGLLRRYGLAQLSSEQVRFERSPDEAELHAIWILQRQNAD